jgi:hypothetical protein
MARGGQAAVKAFGLLPLPDEEPDRHQEIRRRHDRIREFAKEAEALKKGRRLNALAAVQVALGHLAQVARYPSALEMELDLLLTSQGDAGASPVELVHEAYRARLDFEPTGPKVVIIKQ